MVELAAVVGGVVICAGIGELGRRALLGARLQRSMSMSDGPLTGLRPLEVTEG